MHNNGYPLLLPMIGNKNCSALTFLRCLYHILSDFQGRKLLDLIANLVEKTSADYRENFAVVERLVTLFSRCMVSHLQQVMNFTDIFTDEDITRELKFYMTRINEFGIPLDDRQAYTKADWQMWVAAMGTQDQFETITDLVYAFADNTPNMVPMTDW
jgi:hypothetical protein